MSEQFNNPEQALIERLRRAPQPELSAEVHQAMLSRMLEALEHPPVPTPRPRLLRPVSVIVIVVIVGALIAAGVLFVLSQQNQIVPPSTITATIAPSTTASPTVTIEPTLTLVPTNTSVSTVTLLPATAVPAVVTSSVTNEIPSSTPTLILTATSQVMISPTVPPTSSVNTIIVVEGPVQTINVNVISIYGIQIQIDPNDPILKTITVGDNLRIEGTTLAGTTQITVVAITVVVVNVTVNVDTGGNTGGGGNVNPPPSGSGEVWTDDGSCAHAPPDWAPANGWRRRCQGQTKDDKDKGNKQDKGNKDDD